MDHQACEWPLEYGADGPCDALAQLQPEQAQVYERMAIDFLWNWTGRKFGVCTVTVRPCYDDGCDVEEMSLFWGNGPYPLPGYFVPNSAGVCGTCERDPCACEWVEGVRLPGPVIDVTEVVVNGVILDPSAYRVHDDRLVRTDGGTWPQCQDWNVSAAPVPGFSEAGFSTEPFSGQPGTSWQVTYTRGVPVPVGGQVAAAQLACELAKAAANDRSCQLPQRVQTITRQGVSMTLIDSFEDVEQGRTGIWLIDSWVASVTRDVGYAEVLSPEQFI